MFMLPDSFNLHELAKSDAPGHPGSKANLDNATAGQRVVDKVKNELDTYLYSNMMDGYQNNEVTGTTKAVGSDLSRK